MAGNMTRTDTARLKDEQYLSLAYRLVLNQVRDSSTGCLLYIGCTDADGYGKLGVGKHGKLLAHRLSAFLNGIIDSLDDPRMVCHKCDNPPCTEPDHLYAGNASTNKLDEVERGLYRNQNTIKSVCKRGHSLSGENLRVAKDGTRHCKTCHKMLTGRWWRTKGIAFNANRKNRKAA